VRDLLCALWRGRAVANSPVLRLDESTANAGRQKSKECDKQHEMSKRERKSTKPVVKMIQLLNHSKSTAAEAKCEKHVGQTEQPKLDSGQPESATQGLSSKMTRQRSEIHPSSDRHARVPCAALRQERQRTPPVEDSVAHDIVLCKYRCLCESM